jgi:hypothetical protein
LKGADIIGDVIDGMALRGNGPVDRRDDRFVADADGLLSAAWEELRFWRRGKGWRGARVQLWALGRNRGNNYPSTTR